MKTEYLAYLFIVGVLWFLCWLEKMSCERKNAINEMKKNRADWYKRGSLK